MAEGASALWDFSLDFYRRAGVESLCLRLQDEAGDDVNLLMLCCWGGVTGQELSREYFSGLLADAAFVDWRSRCIEPLRDVRRSLKQLSNPGAAALRVQVQALELEAEKLQQDYLCQSLRDRRARPGSGSPAALAGNLQNYRAARSGAPLGFDVVLTLLEAAFPDRTRAELLAVAAV